MNFNLENYAKVMKTFWDPRTINTFYNFNNKIFLSTLEYLEQEINLL